MDNVYIRHAEPSDHQHLLPIINEWWGGRDRSGLLHPLFFTHFRPTSFVALHDHRIVGFLIGFVSQTFADEAYIHLVVVSPDFRGRGVGRLLYERLFEAAIARGCNRVRSITSPANKRSIAFHNAMGFIMEPGDALIDDVPVMKNYDGGGGDRVVFTKSLVTYPILPL